MKFKNAWVLDEKQSLVQKNVYIDQDIVVDANDEMEELDCSHLLVLPGMVNAHFHGTSTVICRWRNGSTTRRRDSFNNDLSMR